MTEFTDAIVTGWGEFPFDMLRYDACWPASGHDVSKMFEPGRRSVTIRTYARGRRSDFDRDFTEARWNSFLWACKEA